MVQLEYYDGTSLQPNCYPFVNLWANEDVRGMCKKFFVEVNGGQLVTFNDLVRLRHLFVACVVNANGWAMHRRRKARDWYGACLAATTLRATRMVSSL